MAKFFTKKNERISFNYKQALVAQKYTNHSIQIETAIDFNLLHSRTAKCQKLSKVASFIKKKDCLKIEKGLMYACWKIRRFEESVEKNLLYHC